MPRYRFTESDVTEALARVVEDDNLLDKITLMTNEVFDQQTLDDAWIEDNREVWDRAYTSNLLTLLERMKSRAVELMEEELQAHKEAKEKVEAEDG